MKSAISPYTCPRTGVVLIIVLWAVTVLGTIALVLGRQSRTEIKITKNLVESSQARGLAEAAVYRAIGELLRDSEIDADGGDDYRDYWSDNDAAFYNVSLGRGVYRVTHADPTNDAEPAYGLLDECSKLNVNTASKEMLMLIPDMTEEAADSILDWRDEDDTPNPNGAESDYYYRFADPYEAKNGMFDTLEELLRVRGVTKDLFYGEDSNLNGILDPNESDTDENLPLDNGDSVLDRGWAAWLTCYSYEKNVDAEGNSRVNINSADQEEFNEKLGELLTPQEISRIIEARGDSENAYESIGDLMAAMEEIRESTGGSSSGPEGGGPQQPERGPGPLGPQSPQELQPNAGPRGNSRGKTLYQRAGPERPSSGPRGGGRQVRPLQQPQQLSERLSQGGPPPEGPGRGGGPGGERTSQGPILSSDKFRQIADKVSIDGEQRRQGRINLNTVTETVLKCVLHDHPELVEPILNYRQSNKFPFDDVGELLDVEGVDLAMFREISERFCVRSGSFSGRFAGYIERSGAYKEIQAVLDRTGDTPRIVYWKVVR